MIEQSFVFEKSFRFSIFFVYVYTAGHTLILPRPVRRAGGALTGSKCKPVPGLDRRGVVGAVAEVGEVGRARPRGGPALGRRGARQGRGVHGAQGQGHHLGLRVAPLHFVLSFLQHGGLGVRSSQC